MPIKMKKSTNPKKKYMITGTKKDGSKITRHFGAAGMRDRTKISNPEERKKDRKKSSKTSKDLNKVRAG